MAKRYISPIQGDRVLLRLLEEDDLPMTLAWRNQDHIRRWFFHSEIIVPVDHRAWYEGYRDRDDDFVFLIEETRMLRRAVGQVALYNIDWTGRRGEYGRLMIGDMEARGRGLALEATETLADEALGAWGLEEIYLEVYADNIAAIRLYERSGFKLRMRQGETLLYTKTPG